MEGLEGLVVGVDNVEGSMVYRVLVYRYNNKKWDFTRQMVTENDLADIIKHGKFKMKNTVIEAGKIKGCSGSLSRFNDRPFVVISEIVTNEDKVVGYKVADYNGAVRNIKINELLKYCEATVRNKRVPIQNGMYIPEDNGKKAHIRAYNEGDYIKEVVERKVSKHVKRVPKKEINKREQALLKLEELFTKEQIKQLMLGRKNGVNIKVYANNELTPEQMAVIRETLEDGNDASAFADPAYDISVMKLLRAHLKYGIDVTYYVNPEFTVEQLGELATGFINGVDISTYANPKIPHNEMAEIRTRLENNIWKEHNVKTKGSWE